jgi:hypothetical protein
MKHQTVMTATLFAAIAMARPAFADSPHFLFADASIINTDELSVAFKDAGLGTGATSIAITVDVANATVVYQCFNNGGNHPKAGNKETVSTQLSVSQNFPVSHGQATGSLVVAPPGPGDFSCPSGQSLYLQSVTYQGIIVSDATGNSLGATPDPISTGAIHVLVP